MTLRHLLYSFILICISIHYTLAQRREILKDWQVGISGGMSYLTMELYKDLSGSMVEMNSKAASTFNFQLYKTVHPNVDLGISYDRTFFNGYRMNSQFVNWLYRTPDFNSSTYHFLPLPIEYRTNLASVYFKGVYHLNPFHSLRKNYSNVNAYFIGGVGWSSIAVELGYIDEENYKASGVRKPLFAKGYGYPVPRSNYVSFVGGGGIHYQISPRFALKSEVTVTLVDADYLDGVHNFDDSVTPDIDTEMYKHRIPVYDIVGSLTVGALYHFNINPPNSYKKNLSIWQLATKQHQNNRYHKRKKPKSMKEKMPFKN